MTCAITLIEEVDANAAISWFTSSMLFVTAATVTEPLLYVWHLKTAVGLLLSRAPFTSEANILHSACDRPAEGSTRETVRG